MFRTAAPFLIVIVSLTAAPLTIAQRDTAYRRIPPRDARVVIGEWEESPRPLYCTLSIIKSSDEITVFHDCVSCTGYRPVDDFEHPCALGGLPIIIRAPRVFSEPATDVTYTIREDGQLLVRYQRGRGGPSERILDAVTPENSLSARWK
jgi:hypothetical protein